MSMLPKKDEPKFNSDGFLVDIAGGLDPEALEQHNERIWSNGRVKQIGGSVSRESTLGWKRFPEGRGKPVRRG